MLTNEFNIPTISKAELDSLSDLRKKFEQLFDVFEKEILIFLDEIVRTEIKGKWSQYAVMCQINGGKPDWKYSANTDQINFAEANDWGAIKYEDQRIALLENKLTNLGFPYTVQVIWPIGLMDKRHIKVSFYIDECWITFERKADGSNCFSVKSLAKIPAPETEPVS